MLTYDIKQACQNGCISTHAIDTYLLPEERASHAVLGPAVSQEL